MPTYERRQTGTPWMLIVMSGLVLTAVVVESAFLANPTWLMLTLAMAAVIGGAVLVVAFILQVLSGEDTPVAARKVEPLATDERERATVGGPIAHA